MISGYLHRLTNVSASTEENPLWLVVLCDMMTNLMLFFLIMYGFTRQPEESRKAMMQTMSEQFSAEQISRTQKQADKVLQKIQEEDVTEILRKKNFAHVELSEKAIRVVLTNPVLFVSGQSALSEQSKKDLMVLAETLKTLQNPVVVEGHTDNVPLRIAGYASNWELSVARAASVVDFLSTEGGLPPGRFITAGYGEFRPVDSNETPEGRARNRRIEVRVQRTAA
jgi:chemotaxis protein MotB